MHCNAHIRLCDLNTVRQGYFTQMPTLTRLIITLAVLASLVFAAMLALVYYVQPRQVEVTIDVPLETLRQAKPAQP
jgi:hypothetical protein